MITFAICLLYYGAALLGYQIYLWFSEGRWTAFPISRGWYALFGTPHIESALLDGLVQGLLALPLALFFLVSGLTILGSVFATRHLTSLYKRRLRRRWILQQCGKLGFYPWSIPAVLSKLDEDERQAAAAAKERRTFARPR
jgi:hypothetical protein